MVSMLSAVVAKILDFTCESSCFVIALELKLSDVPLSLCVQQQQNMPHRRQLGSESSEAADVGADEQLGRGTR